MKNKKSKKEKRQKFDYGGMILDFINNFNNREYIQSAPRELPLNRIQSPYEALQDNNIRKARAMAKAENNPLTSALDIIGGLSMQIGSNLIGKGMNKGENFGDFFKRASNQTDQVSPSSSSENLNIDNSNNFNPKDIYTGLDSLKQFLAFGGNVEDIPVNVEGGEVAELPWGEMFEIKGAKHEQGGVDMDLPESTNIFSDRIKIDGLSMADRKKKRERKESKLEKKLEKNLYDTLAKNALNRTRRVNMEEENFDKSLQEEANLMLGGNERQEFATGTGMRGISSPEDLSRILDRIRSQNINPILNVNEVPFEKPTAEEISYPEYNYRDKKGFSDILGSIGETLGKVRGNNYTTFGDALGIIGNLSQGRAGLRTTLEQRAGDTPNINPYENFGRDSLKALEKMKAIQSQLKDQRVRELDRVRSSSSARNRNSAMGVNTQRALDLATDSSLNQYESQIMSEYLNAINSILNSEVQTKLSRDEAVMRGEALRDDHDRQDRAAFYSNLAQDRKSLSQALTHTARTLNKMKERQVNANFLNNTTEYVNADIMSGNISLKEGIDVVPSNDRLALFEANEGWKELNYTKEQWDKESKSKKYTLMMNWKDNKGN